MQNKQKKIVETSMSCIDFKERTMLQRSQEQHDGSSATALCFVNLLVCCLPTILIEESASFF